MTNKEHIFSLQKEIEAGYLKLKKTPDVCGHDDTHSLLIKIIAQKFRLHYPSSLEASDIKDRNYKWYSWFYTSTNRLNFWDRTTTASKLELVDSCINCDDILVWCFNNIRV